MRRVKARSSSCSQVILVYLHPFHHNSLLCSQKSPKKSPKNPILGFKVKVINIDNPKKLVANACYVKQHVHSANFSYPLSFGALVRGDPSKCMEKLYGYWN